MSSIKHIKNINFDKLELHNEVNIVGDIIVLDTKIGIRTGKDINKSPFVPLARSTIKRKGNDKILKDTGQMMQVYLKPRATKGRERADVNVPKGRDGTNRIVVGQIHNIGDGVPKRTWFGLGTRVRAKIKRALKLRLKEKLRQRRQML